MTELEFRAELKNLHGGYLFFGDEDYLKFSYAKEVKKNTLDGSFDEFNHVVLYGEDFSPSALYSAIATVPLMSEKKVVELRSLEFKALKKDDIRMLEEVLSSLAEYDHTVFILRADAHLFDAGRLPSRPSEMYKMLTKYLTPVEFSFPTSARLRSWIGRHFTEGKIRFDLTLCDYLVEICGHSMWNLSNEIEKLCAYAKFNSLSSLTKEDIDKVCCKTIEYDDFQLTNALLSGSRDFVFETLRRQKLNHEPANIILASIVKMYTEIYSVSRLQALGTPKDKIASMLKIHEFKVGKYLAKIAKTSPARIERSLELCREADLKSKSYSNVSSYIAVERLVSTLCAL
ncbi:MAG: DNA polymerase III subunit delta [Clostridia bacterium]|nr:DNA polymerase III subunit delta [Clostridia bacterium]